MISNIELVFTSRESTRPNPWNVFAVVPVQDERILYGFAGLTKTGDLSNFPDLAKESYTRDEARALYEQITDGWGPLDERELTELPGEFFNHELKDLDPLKASKAARIMSEYGLLGYNQDGEAQLLAGIRAVKSGGFSREAHKMPPGYYQRDVMTWFDFPSGDALGESEKAYLAGFGDALDKIEATGRGLYRIVTLSQVISTKHTLDDAAKIVKAFALFDTDGERAEYLGYSAEGLEGHLETTICKLNGYLSQTSSAIGYVSPDEPENVRYPGKVYRAGSLEQAIAQQIKDFAVSIEAGYRVCTECGEVYVTKRPKSGGKRTRKQPSDGNIFCCERCANRFKQRELRKSPYYQAKLAEKKAAKKAAQDEANPAR